MMNHMAFCTNCGEEVAPGTKFCESCGIPVEQQPGMPVPGPASIPVPVPHVPSPRPPLVTPPSPKKPLPVPMIVGVVLVLAVIAAGIWFVGLPALQKNTRTIVVPSVPATLPVTPSVKIVQQEGTLVPAATATVTPARKLEGRFEEYYDEVYSLDQFFAFGQKETFPYDLETPPLYVKYNLTPKLITREKVINIGMSSEKTINVTYANPNAWFEIRVLDAGNGAVIADQGYGKDFPDVTRSEFMVRNPGKYLIEFSGNDVTAEIRILQGTS
jgi:hypothetical protein